MISIISNPRILVLFAAVIIVSGLAALHSLPRTEDPRLTPRFALVITPFPGASAERVETLVSEKLENQLRTMPEIMHVESVSTQGLSLITIILQDEVTSESVSQVWAEVRDEIEEVVPVLPDGALPPRLDNERGDAFTLIFGLQLNADKYNDIAMLGRYADELESVARGVTGTDYVLTVGMPDEEVVVDVDYEKALSMGLTIADISSRIAVSDAKVTAGEVVNQHYRMALEVKGGFDNEERIRRIPLMGEQQAALSVGDIAEVSHQPKTPAESIALINGQRGIAVAIRMQPSQRGDLWRDRLIAAVDIYRASLPDTISVEVLFDQESYTSERLKVLVGNVLLGFFLIALVLWLSLGWRSALMVSIALPLTILFALGCMKLFSLPIHQMSVTGLIVALGIMVDNAIVMVDTVARYRRQGVSGIQAAAMSVKHLWVPLLGSTLTTILTFMPIVLLPGNAGEFVSGIALTVIFSLIGSYLISHILVAGLAGRFLTDTQSDRWYNSGVQLPRVSAAFANVVSRATCHPKKIILMVACLPLLGIWMADQIPEQFFPPSDRDMINFEVYLPQSTSITETERVAALIDAEIAKFDGIKSRHWFIGSNTPSFYYNLMQRRDNAQYYAQAMLTMDAFSTANTLVPLMQKKLDVQFPDAQIIVRRLEQGPPFNAPVEIRVYGPGLDALAGLGEEIRRRLLATKNVTHARSTLSDAVPKVWLNLDETILLSVGLSFRDAANQSQQAIDGVVQSSILQETETLPVRVRAKDYKVNGIESIQNFPLLGKVENHGVTFATPISSLGRVQIEPVRNAIPRRDGSRINTIEAYLRDGVLPAEVLADIQQQLAEAPLDLPPGYRIEVGGESEKRSEAIGKLLGSFGLIAMLLIVAIVMSFDSFRLSVIIILVAIQAAALGVLALALSGFPFGFTAIIGLMALIGLAINAAIVIIAELKTNALALKGNQAAIVQSVLSCSRHIASTTITTCMGFLPLLLGGGGFWPPFAIIIAGGTLLTTALSFLFVPAIFQLIVSRWPMKESSVAIPLT